MPYSNPILGGTALVRPAIKSPNFVAGSTGWSVNQDGSAQFNDIALTGGSLVITGSGQGAFVYSGTPALGNLIVSMASAAGTDAYGNTYPKGFGLTDGKIPGGLINAGSIDATKVSFVATDIGGITTTVSTIAPTSANVGDIWIDSSNGNLLKRWNGSAWDSTPFDSGAISDGAITSNLIAANAIVAGQIAAGAIDGQTLNAVNINGTNITGADFIVSGTNGGIFIYASGGTITQTFTSSTTWTAPAGVTSVKVEAWGGGGGGGGFSGLNGSSGGGGGEYASESTLSVTPGAGYPIVIGNGGTGGSSGANGSGGGSTTFGTTRVVAHGGGGGLSSGQSAAGAGGAGSTNSVHFNGGAGGFGQAGSSGSGGGGGGSAGTSSTGNAGLPSSGGVGGAGASAVTGGGPGGSGGTWACVDASVEIFTQRGWLTCDQVRVGDVTRAINAVTGEMVDSVVTRVGIHNARFPVVALSGNLNVSATPQHRWLVWADAWIWRTTDTLDTQDQIPLGDGGFVKVGDLTAVAATSDRVWCPTTEHGNWLARSRGTVFVTGNKP